MPLRRFKRNVILKTLLFVTFQGMGKRKYVQPGQTQHTKSTRDLITWRGNESTDPVSTYRAHYPSSRPSSCVFGFNETEPIHVRSNHELRRRQLRASSAPPSQRRTAPLLAWNEPDEAQHGKPGVGVRQPIRESGGGFASSTPFAQTAPAAVRSQTPSQSFTVSETIVPLSTTWPPATQTLRSRMLQAVITNNREFMKKMLFAGQHIYSFCRESVLMALNEGQVKICATSKVNEPVLRNSNVKNEADENGAKNGRSKTRTWKSNCRRFISEIKRYHICRMFREIF